MNTYESNYNLLNIAAHVAGIAAALAASVPVAAWLCGCSVGELLNGALKGVGL